MHRKIRQEYGIKVILYPRFCKLKVQIKLVVISYLAVTFQRCNRIGNDLFSLGFYKPYIKHFSVWNVGHLFARGPALSSQHIPNKIFFDVRPKVVHSGAFDVRNSYLFVLKGHVFLGPDPGVFQSVVCLRHRTHSLHFYFFHHCDFLSCFLAFSLSLCIATYLLHSTILTGVVPCCIQTNTRMDLWE